MGALYRRRAVVREGVGLQRTHEAVNFAFALLALVLPTGSQPVGGGTSDCREAAGVNHGLHGFWWTELCRRSSG